MNSNSIIIVVRHGKYLQNGNLAEEGKAQIRQVAKKILTMMNGSKVVILSSVAPRTIESAEIISTCLRTSYQAHHALLSTNGQKEDLPTALRLIKTAQKKADIVVVVTHLEYSRSLIPYYAEQELGITGMNINALSPGEAWVFDLGKTPPSLERIRP